MAEPSRTKPQTPDAAPANFMQSFSISSENPVADVAAIVQRILPHDLQEVELANDSPLMQSGLTSASAVNFRNTLQTIFPGVSLPAVFVFDFPTIASISQYLVESGATPTTSQDPPAGTQPSPLGDNSSGPISISSIRCRNLSIPWMVHPLSFFQEQMLMAFIADPYSEAYNIPARISPQTESIGISAIS